MQSDIMWGSLFRFCAENRGTMMVEPIIENDGYTIFIKIPSKNIVLKQELPQIMDELEAIKYIENEVVKAFKKKLDELVSVQLKKEG